MPNAKTTLTVSFEEAMEKIKGFRRSELVIRFRYNNAEDKPVAVRARKVSTLFADWYGDCAHCPPNDTTVRKVHILINPLCTALDIAEDVVFEQLMDRIEDVTTGHKA